MTLSRRSLITGLVSFAVTAPSIVRAASLMSVKVMDVGLTLGGIPIEFEFSGFYTLYSIDAALYEQLRDGVKISGYDIMQWKAEA